MKTTNWAMLLGLLVTAASCGGSTDASDGQGGGGGQDASSDASSDASFDAADDTAADVADETGWEECFDDENGGVSTSLKICSDGCVIKEHQLDCCGSVRYVGISTESAAQFDACEALWRAHFPQCGCASSPPKIEQPSDGEVQDVSEVNVDCMNCTMDSCVCITH